MIPDVKNKINLALQLHQAGKLVDAEKMYIEILKMSPDDAYTLNLLGLLKLQNGQIKDAELFIKKALFIAPCAYFYESLGRVYTESGDYYSAIECYKKSLELNPDDFDTWFNLGLAYKNNHLYDESINAYKNALSVNPAHAGGYFNLGNVYELKNETDLALEYYKKAYELNDKDDYIKYFLAISYIKTKNFKEGWRLYESRPSKELSIISQAMEYKDLIASKPLWQGEPIDNKTLFVYYEAGYGDTLMFARFLPLLEAKCANVLFKPQYGFIDLFKENYSRVKIIDNKTLPQDVYFDFHIPVMSLPYALGLNSEEIPFAQGYIKANPQKVEDYRQKYFNNNKFKVGIKWKGNAECELSRVISLNYFYKLFEIPNIQFYSVQKDDGIEEIENLPENYNIINLGETFNNFSDTAAALENLDLIICNDTSVAHLAGAMGKKCWILLPFVQNWRWHTDISYSTWYKSVKLFKQSQPDNWAELFDRIYEELKISI